MFLAVLSVLYLAQRVMWFKAVLLALSLSDVAYLVLSKAILQPSTPAAMHIHPAGDPTHLP